MHPRIPLDKMSATDKLQAIEEIWNRPRVGLDIRREDG